jgi:signal recognition particle GTPase
LGCSWQREFISFPKADINTQEVEALKKRIERRLPKIDFQAEIARREVLIFPLYSLLIGWISERELNTRATSPSS